MKRGNDQPGTLGGFPDPPATDSARQAELRPRATATATATATAEPLVDTLNVNDVQTPTEAFLMIADATGRNARTVASARGDNAINMILGAVDWR